MNINMYERCLCNERIVYRYQCKHEYAYDRKIHLHKYHRRWFNSRSDFLPSTFLCQVPATTEENRVNIENESIDDSINNSKDKKPILKMNMIIKKILQFRMIVKFPY